jgi:hypothetical protein
MDERFGTPAEEDEAEHEDTTDSTTSKQAKTTENTTQESKDTTSSREDPRSVDKSPTESADDALNIRDDWDSSTIYIEPEQSEDIEVTFTRLKKQLKRDGYILEKNKHFYRAVFEIAFEDRRKETKEKVRELVEQDTSA